MTEGVKLLSEIERLSLTLNGDSILLSVLLSSFQGDDRGE